MQAAECLHEDILDHAQSIPNLSWPPSIDDLSSDERKPPESLESFLPKLFTNKDHPNRDMANRLIQSYSLDLINGITSRKTITAKHFSFWAQTSYHNLTGQNVSIQIVNHLSGHHRFCKQKNSCRTL